MSNEHLREQIQGHADELGQFVIEIRNYPFDWVNKIVLKRDKDRPRYVVHTWNPTNKFFSGDYFHGPDALERAVECFSKKTQLTPIAKMVMGKLLEPVKA